MCVRNVPPEDSPYYNYFDVENGIGLLEDCLSECMINLNDIFCDTVG